MTPPTPEFQLQFLSYLQRLLSEGEFVATYKYALLMALADLSVEKGDDDGTTLELSSKDIADKFISYYWRQSRPYVTGNQQSVDGIIHQNTGKQARVVNLVRDAQSSLYSVSNPDALDAGIKRGLRRDVAQTIRVMPLWKLQVLGRDVVDFLYPNTGGSTVELKPGVAYCFRRFHGFVVHLAQGGWLRFVRSRSRNRNLLGEAVDLADFMFGAQRAPLGDYRQLLRELQSGRCFYCGRSARKNEVDHFIPWARYSADLGHNFVLACRACNNAKRDLLAAPGHLERWLMRNEDHGRQMAEYFDERVIVYDLRGSVTIARWAYEQAQIAEARVWVEGKETVALGGEWRGMFA